MALALKRGCDIGCDHVYNEIPEAIARGLITEADVDRALARTLGTRFKLGMFDPAEDVPFASIGMDVVACDAHRQLAYRAATESVVLLKNKNNILPIKPSTRKIFVTGPTATSMEVLLGNYYGFNDQMITLLEGITGRVPEGMGMEYHLGALLKHPREIKETWAPYMAQSADVSIVCVGFTPQLEGEEGEALLTPLNGDRESISLPASQVNYIKELAIHGAKIVLVVTGGSPIALGEVEDMVDAILFVWYPGMEGGRAVADVLFGDVSPAGKLPLTFPKSLDQLPGLRRLQHDRTHLSLHDRRAALSLRVWPVVHNVCVLRSPDYITRFIRFRGGGHGRKHRRCRSGRSCPVLPEARSTANCPRPSAN